MKNRYPFKPFTDGQGFQCTEETIIHRFRTGDKIMLIKWLRHWGTLNKDPQTGLKESKDDIEANYTEQGIKTVFGIGLVAISDDQVLFEKICSDLPAIKDNYKVFGFKSFVEALRHYLDRLETDPDRPF